jgi:hypothetical protein
LESFKSCRSRDLPRVIIQNQTTYKKATPLKFCCGTSKRVGMEEPIFTQPGYQKYFKMWVLWNPFKIYWNVFWITNKTLWISEDISNSFWIAAFWKMDWNVAFLCHIHLILTTSHPVFPDIRWERLLYITSPNIIIIIIIMSLENSSGFFLTFIFLPRSFVLTWKYTNGSTFIMFYVFSHYILLLWSFIPVRTSFHIILFFFLVFVVVVFYSILCLSINTLSAHA